MILNILPLPFVGQVFGGIILVLLLDALLFKGFIRRWAWRRIKGSFKKEQ